MPDDNRTMVAPAWRCIPVEVSQGEAMPCAKSGQPSTDGLAIAAVQPTEAGEVVLMLGISKGSHSLAAVLSLDDWNRFNVLAQAAMIDAANLELERRRRAGHVAPPPLCGV